MLTLQTSSSESSSAAVSLLFQRILDSLKKDDYKAFFTDVLAPDVVFNVIIEAQENKEERSRCFDPDIIRNGANFPVWSDSDLTMPHVTIDKNHHPIPNFCPEQIKTLS